jgi:DNA-binding NtrC family response regulator
MSAATAPVSDVRGEVLLADGSVRARPPRVLVADPAASRTVCGQILEGLGCDVDLVADGRAALRALATNDYDVVFLDVALPGVSGPHVLGARPSLPTDARFILFSDSPTLEEAVEAIRLGAHDFLRKPCDEDDLRRSLARSLGALGVEEGAARGQGRVEAFQDMVGATTAMQRVYRLVSRVAGTRASVLVTGETGTGKELVARAVHRLSPRAERPFVALNCAAIPEALLESELFGHVRGAFTGAVQSRKGLIEEAEGGTLFLDEISTLTRDVQVKLLRVLQDRTVQRVGSNAARPVDFRLVAATNDDVLNLVASGSFREDLFFRLDVFPIDVPPLRHRREDVPLLAAHFLRMYGQEHGLEPPRLTQTTVRRMMAYDWPGNVRELEHFVERSVIMHAGRDTFPFDLPRPRPGHAGTELLGEALSETWTLERLEREYLLATLERTDWQQSEAAERLGINRRTIHRKLRRYREEGLLGEGPLGEGPLGEG